VAGSRQSLRVVPSESFGSRLRRQRLADDLTQAELGERFSVRQQTIGAWERGERPQSRFLSPLADYLGLEEQELAWLIDSQPELTTEQQPATSGVPDKPADTDGAAMRQVAWSFVLDQRSRPLPPDQAADIYKEITAYFRARAIEKLFNDRDQAAALAR
jgi:transcriptional regulator with XRE-family HTH domain